MLHKVLTQGRLAGMSIHCWQHPPDVDNSSDKYCERLKVGYEAASLL